MICWHCNAPVVGCDHCPSCGLWCCDDHPCPCLAHTEVAPPLFESEEPPYWQLVAIVLLIAAIIGITWSAALTT
jgi:hypothetical protein